MLILALQMDEEDGERRSGEDENEQTYIQTGEFPVFMLVNHPVKCTLATLTFGFVLLNKLHVEKRNDSKTRVKSWNIL